MEYLLRIGLFLLGLLFLVKGADVFVEGALFLARRFHIPELVIGATVVSIGTTLPETIVSATAAMHGHCDIAYGNAIGSIICNTGVIVALVLVLRPPAIKRASFLQGMLFFFIAAAVYIGSAILFNGIPRFVATILLGIFFLYIFWTFKSDKQQPRVQQRPDGSTLKNLLLIAVSAGALYFGSVLMVENAQKFAIWLNVPHKVVALTVVAFGTSLPELVTAIISVRKGHGALSVGNVLGANFFNLVLVSGTSSLILPTIVDAVAVRTDLIVMLFMMLLFTLPIIVRGKGSRVQGAALISLYLFYVFGLYH